MNIKSCGFTTKNLRIAVLSDGNIILANSEDKRVYQVSVVKILKPKMPKGSKKVKIKRKGEGKR